MNTKPQVLLVEFRIQTEYIDAFDAAIRENARASLTNESCCRRFDVCRDPADAALFLLYEIYDDDVAVALHLTSSHFLAMDAATSSWVQEKTVRRLEGAQS